MKVKEVIEYIEHYVEALEILGEPESKHYTALKKAIPLLKQGEALKTENEELKAYKKIVKKLKEKYGDKRIEFSVTRDNEVSFIGKIKYLINDYEQKYLMEERK